MRNTRPLHHGYRFPAPIISYAVQLYFGFQLSRDIKELRFERGVIVSRGSIRRRVDAFGVGLTRCVKAPFTHPVRLACYDGTPSRRNVKVMEFERYGVKITRKPVVSVPSTPTAGPRSTCCAIRCATTSRNSHGAQDCR